MLMQYKLCVLTVATMRLRYSELIEIPTFEDRFNYLKLDGSIGRATFGGNRYLNQRFYASKEWKDFRRDVIIRDNGCDLAFDDGDHIIYDRILIHHLNPITIDDIRTGHFDRLLDYDNAVCVCHNTHEAIHYGNEVTLGRYHERTPNDTKLW